LLIGAATQGDHRIVVTYGHKVRVFAKSAEILGDANQIRVRELLVWERQYMMLKPGRADILNDYSIQWLG
jgi:hypothetical protein